MESIKTKESFESFLARISAIYNENGLTPELKEEIEIWHNRRYQETDNPASDAIEIDKIQFQLELAKIYIYTYQDDLAYDVIDDLRMFIDGKIVGITRDIESITTEPELWIRTTKNQRPNKIILSIEEETIKLRDDLARVNKLLQELLNL